MTLKSLFDSTIVPHYPPLIPLTQPQIRVAMEFPIETPDPVFPFSASSGGREGLIGRGTIH